MHPSKDIQGTKGKELEGRKIVLGVTGSVAAIKSPELARELMRHGAEVRAVMSKKATELITPQLMHWATANEVVVELTGALEHVELARWGDLVLVAPATANTVSKIAWAIDDTPVTSVVSVALGLQKSVALVPAMHASMYRHKLFQESLAKLRSAGVHLLEPLLEEERAKFPGVDRVTDFVIALLGPKDMEDMRVLVTAGPTVEPIDPIKIITNRSSGKMGIALARTASMRGAKVTLIYGPGTEIPPPNVNTIRVQTTREMKDAFDRELKKKPDIILCAAAPQDFVVDEVFKEKLRHDREVTLKLKPAPRLLEEVRERVPEAFVVGFKAEFGVSDEQLLNVARGKLEEHRLDMVVANDVSRAGAGFGADTNEVIILTPSGSKRIMDTKDRIARAIIDAAVDKLRGT
jgi:phosphopantothenoylcysteine decarboxylase/phosphopantothenate--cysteine ligase